MVELWDYSIQPRKKKGKTLRREQIDLEKLEH